MQPDSAFPPCPSLPRRIFVTGQSGSGKSTLARALSVWSGAPCYLFDEIAYESQTHRRRTFEERLADVQRIVEQPAWVVDCWYLGWTTPLLEAADQIVWLDLPWRTAARRIIFRHIRASLAGDNPHGGLRQLRDFLRAERKRYTAAPASVNALLASDDANNRATTERTLASYGIKVVRCRRPGEVKVYLQGLPALA